MFKYLLKAGTSGVLATLVATTVSVAQPPILGITGGPGISFNSPLASSGWLPTSADGGSVTDYALSYNPTIYDPATAALPPGMDTTGLGSLYQLALVMYQGNDTNQVWSTSFWCVLNSNQ